MRSTENILFFARHFWDFSKIFQILTHFFAKDKKKTLLLGHDREKNFFSAFASVSITPVAPQETNSGASFLSSNGHRNHQNRSVLPLNK
jgi:hypothetical protein